MTGALLLAAALACGSERAAVKHMSDPQAGVVNITAIETTIEALGSRPEPDPPVKGHEARGVTEQEFDTYVVEGTITVAKREDDQDVHLALSDGHGHTMIVEIVDPRCAKGSIVLNDLLAARYHIWHATGRSTLTTATLKDVIGKRVRVSGVAFFDKLHGQSGAADNGIELHPVTEIEFLP